MDQINPFTNTPTNPQAPAPGNAPGAPQPQKPKEPKIKTEFSIKPIIKGIVLTVIGVVIAKLAFDSVMPNFKAKPEAETKAVVKPAAKTSSKSTAAKGSKAAKGKSQANADEPSLSETFAAAKKTVKPAADTKSSDPFVVSGIFVSDGDDKSSAIINNKIVQVGSTIDGALVEEIAIEGVTLSKDGKSFRLRNK